MVEVKWTDFAIQNLNEIGDYIEKKSYTSYASRVVSGLFAAVDVLERFPVSYTHLRAHETKANLVCRLLPAKKKHT